jgi:hypothetical protein
MYNSTLAEARENNLHILLEDIKDFVADDTVLASTQRAINATVHSVTNKMPGAFIYQRDMLLPIQSFINSKLVHQKRTDSISKNLFKENQTRRPFDWQGTRNGSIGFGYS